MLKTQEDEVRFSGLCTELSTIMVDITVAVTRMHCRVSMEGAGGVRVATARFRGQASDKP